MDPPNTRGATWRESLGMHVLVNPDGKEVGRVWGLRANAPWHASAHGRDLGEFSTLAAARVAVECALRS
jgi:hypothetical protein